MGRCILPILRMRHTEAQRNSPGHKVVIIDRTLVLPGPQGNHLQTGGLGTEFLFLYVAGKALRTETAFQPPAWSECITRALEKLGPTPCFTEEKVQVQRDLKSSSQTRQNQE